MCCACTVDFVAQKIRSLDFSAMSAKEISNMLKKDVVHLGLNKKSAKELRAALDGYVKMESFTIHFRRSFHYKLLNLVNRIKRTKLNKQVVWNGYANIAVFSTRTNLQNFTIRNITKRSFGK